MTKKLKYAKYVREMNRPDFRPDLDVVNADTPVVMDQRFMPACNMHFECYTITKPCVWGLLMPGSEYAGDWKEIFAEDDDTSILEDSPMYHNHLEVFLYLSTDPVDNMNLGGEVEFWLGLGEQAEKFTFDKPTCIYVPPGLVHEPEVFRRVDRPILKLVIFNAPRLSNQHVKVLPPEFEKEFKDQLYQQ